MKALASCIAALILATPLGSSAAVTPSAGPGDPRIRVVRYDPDQVVALQATLGYALTIEFGEGEHIENVAIGDALGWQVTPNRKANLLFLKPVQRAAPTDMTVITSLRRYTFALSAAPPPRNSDRQVIFGLRFDYPPAFVAVVEHPLEKPPAPPQDANHAYSYEGSSKNLPTRVFDDGHSTYFTFADTMAYPAIFSLGPDNKESLVNVANRDGYVIVDQVARGYVLRRGSEVTKLFNDGFREAKPGPLSPKPRKPHRGLFQ